MNDFTPDPELEQQLHRLDIPEHHDDFFDELTTKLRAEPAPTATQVVSRSWAARHRWALASPVAIAAGVMAVLLTSGALTSDGSPTSPGGGAPPTSELRPLLAADVVQRAADAWQKVQGVSGTADQVRSAVRESGIDVPAEHRTQEFRRSSDGDLWVRSTDAKGFVTEESYVASTGDYRQYSSDPQDTYAQFTHQANDPKESSLLRDLSSFTSTLRAMAAQPGAVLQETVYDGRPAWQLEASGVFDRFGITADHAVLTVDQATALPVHVVTTRNGKPFSETSVHGLQVDPVFGPDAFTVKFPAGKKVFDQQAGFVRTELAAAASRASYVPLQPSFVPAGFELRRITFNEDAGAGGPEGMNANNRDVVTLVYRKGLAVLQVTTRLSANDGQEWNDPIGAEGAAANVNRRTTLVGGAFGGVTAQVLTESPTLPQHLWAVGPKVLLTVAGDLSADELVQVAQSMEPAVTK